MSFKIDGLAFDGVDGVVLTTESEARPYTTPASPYVGVQVLAPRGRPFPLTLTRYTDADLVEPLVRQLKAYIGERVTIVDGATQYFFPPWQVRFAVLDVTIKSAQQIPFAMTGARGSTVVTYSPAGVVVSEWILQAVPTS